MEVKIIKFDSSQFPILQTFTIPQIPKFSTYTPAIQPIPLIQRKLHLDGFHTSLITHVTLIYPFVP